MLNGYLKVAGHDGMVRDMSSHAIVNTNTSEYDLYIQRRNSMQTQNELLLKHEEDINTIKEDLHEIKQLLLQSIKGNN